MAHKWVHQPIRISHGFRCFRVSRGDPAVSGQYARDRGFMHVIADSRRKGLLADDNY